ncbi:transmembrane amino acid transporter protein-domain-containing protein, partial [Dimargaris cristalligena]
LLGGDTTRHIYKWSEDQEQAARRRRSQSVADLTQMANHQQLPPNATAAATAQQMKQPGGFRRHFVAQKAVQEGQPPPNFLTSNFIDFIALYGHFAGDDFPSDIDDDDYEDPLDDSEHQLTRPLRRSLLATPNERTPLRRSGGAPTDRTGPAPRVVAAATASPRKAFFLLMKSFVGTGVLFLPRSFYNGGITFSALLLALVAYLALYAMLLLVECYAKIPGSFGDIGMALYGPKARYAVLFSIVFSQIGFCCAYTIFVARNLQELFQNMTDCRVNLSMTFWVYIQLAVYIPLAMVRKIKNFSLAAVVADVFIMFGLGYLYYFDIKTLATTGAAAVRHFNSANFSLFIGTAVFSFEGIGLVLPIVSSMKEPQKFPRVLTLSMIVSAFIFVSDGALSYLALGDKVATVVLLNLPADSPVVHSVQFLYSLAIIFSVPLQMFPAIRILEAGLFVRSGKGNPWVKWQKNGFRVLLALFIALISLVGADKLDRFVALIGSFACIPLSFIYPSLFHLKAVARTRWRRITDILIAVFGAIIMVYVTYTTLESWVLDEPEPPSSRC